LNFITDIQGFLLYLGQKVGIGNACVNCNKAFASIEAVRSHMISTSHSKLPFGAEASEELSDFYDFSADAENVGVVALPGDVLPQRKVVEADTYFVRFDDGRVIGHRALVTFYKQNVLVSNPSEAALLRSKVSSAYRRLTATAHVDIPRLDKVARIAREEQHTKEKYKTMQVQIAKNSMFVATGNARYYC